MARMRAGRSVVVEFWTYANLPIMIYFIQPIVTYPLILMHCHGVSGRDDSSICSALYSNDHSMRSMTRIGLSLPSCDPKQLLSQKGNGHGGLLSRIGSGLYLLVCGCSA